MSKTRDKRVIIVGAGLSGTMAAVHVLNKAQVPTEVVLIEKVPARRSGGIAYSADTAGEEHYTNLIIERLSAFDDQPNHLLNWLETTDRSNWPSQYRTTNFGPYNVLPRRLYQLYLDEILQKAQKSSHYGTLMAVDGEVEDIKTKRKSAKVKLHDGRSIEGHMVILATGNVEAKTGKFGEDLDGYDGFIADQYSHEGKETMRDIDEDDTVFVLGTGLSGFDAATSLLKQGHTGKIILFSRGGHTHITYPKNGIEPPFEIQGEPVFMQARTIEELCRMVQTDFWERTQFEGHAPERVIEAYQRFIPELAKRFSKPEIRALVDQYAAMVNTQRIGVGSEISREIKKAQANGQLEIIAGDIESIEPSFRRGFAIGYTPKGASQAETMEADYVISSLGRDATAGPLWTRLMNEGKAQRHFTGLGIEVSRRGRVLDEAGNKIPNVLALGPIRAGANLVTHGLVAAAGQNVPGLRGQAELAANMALQKMNRADTKVKEMPKSWLASVRAPASSDRHVAAYR